MTPTNRARAALATAVLATTVACGSSDDTSGAGSAGAGGGAATVIPFARPEKTYSHGDPSGAEQELLELVNRARRDPAAEGKLLVDLDSVQGALAQFKLDKQELVAAIGAIPPAPPLAFDAKLAAAAKFHSDDMAKNGFQEHDGSAGESPFDRIKKAGYDFSLASENIFAHATDMLYCHAAFLIDWGNAEPGHRKAILDVEGRQRDLGISVVENPPNPKVGPYVVTQDFGMPLAPGAGRYLVGVVYADANGNGRYDAGEGLAGHAIVPNVGTTYAVTSASGGYAIPFPKTLGAFKVQHQSSEGAALEERDVTIDGENAKEDFVVKPVD